MENEILLSDFSRFTINAKIVDITQRECTVYIPAYSTCIKLIKSLDDKWEVIESPSFYNPRWIAEIIYYITRPEFGKGKNDYLMD